MSQDVAPLPDDINVLKAMIRELLEQLRKQGLQLEQAEAELKRLLRRHYGRKSERSDQPTLFDDPADATPAAEPLESTTNTDAPRARRKGHGRRKLPADLPRERVVHDLSDAEKLCPCCHEPRDVIGEQTSEQVEYRPAKLFVLEHVRPTYVCVKCVAKPLDPATPEAETPDLIATAPKPPQAIDKCLAGPGLLAHVVTSKYADHLPLHRQESILARLGIELSRTTPCDWMAAVANALTPLYALIKSRVLLSKVVQTDETRVPVQDPSQAKTKAGRLWIYVGDRDHPYLLYDYRPDKSRDGPDDILQKYKGFLQADAANVFDGVYRPGSIAEVGCWAHARRYFHEARDSDPTRAAEAIARIGAFYGVEHEAKEIVEREKLDDAAADGLRLRWRQEKTLPKLAEFAAWLERTKADVLPKSPMGQAIAYAQRHWNALMRFAEHGFLNIDNNAAERALRAVAVGRKNWLFAGSDAGGRTAAILYTLTQTCKRHGIDPFAYLRDVLERFPTTPESRLGELLPNAWTATRRAEQGRG